MQATATSRNVRHMRLISKDFPWTIDIIPRRISDVITCGDVWKALHAGLQEKLKDSDWGYLNIQAEGHMTNRKAVVDAMEQRGGENPIRIDWLGDRNIFKGLEKDDGYARRRLLPGEESCEETWIARMDR